MLVLKAGAKETLARALTSVLPRTLLAHAPFSWSRGGADGPVLEALQLSWFRTRDSQLIGGPACFTALAPFLRHFPAFHSLRGEDGVRQRGRCCL